ncbi:MAG: cobalamin biosynthesis protein CobW [Alphaproteobacteria bacterium]|jgi:cobalamin biosynthesis protein CobW|nr:cobalamin biosynthesis protein CobW [Alphaproteobacteria bacterium]MBT4965022.1 cobalamin biosynthesis protein CobW [Alphaproteobacteria bacterium]MBT5161085.1 cobalamin biosynthesis protein CobW [Alphaproteobacteria bacterium]MBT5916896.1 cobalamin biosynthesis protein CobW [Alphaproteobacteria bacterium]MBT6387136.1 cobalamin biosynthesis protein CobW [Alphaproteobacteria bacterium]
MTNLQRIPATVITGFLGAGKTSMIRHLLETANGKRLALIINEFGDVGVDGNILKACGAENCSEEDIVELANGCICCTVADDFVPTMEALLDRPDGIDHIIIETSGLALPKPLLKAFNWPAIRTRITVDGVVTVVDGPAFADGLFAENPEAIEAQRQADDDLDHDSPLAELFEDQLACADLVVMNKSDLLAAEDVPQITQDLKDSLGKSVKVITTQHGAIDATTLLGLEAAVEDDLENRHSHHDEEDDHEHDDFESFVVSFDTVTSPEIFVEKLRGVLTEHDVLRMKGFIDVEGKDMRLLVQGVGDRFQHYYDRDWAADEDRKSQLVVIGLHGLDEAAIRELILN